MSGRVESLRCREPSCADFGDPDFGEATCPSSHADFPGRHAGDSTIPIHARTRQGPDMTGDTTTTPAAPPQPWVCPTPDLDLADVEWTAHEIEPGTPYHDEPTEMIDPGWYVLGYYDEHDPRDAPPITIKIEGAYDEHGCDRGKYLAWHLVGVLTHVHSLPPEPRFARLRRFGNGVADVVGTLAEAAFRR